MLILQLFLTPLQSTNSIRIILDLLLRIYSVVEHVVWYGNQKLHDLPILEWIQSGQTKS